MIDRAKTRDIFQFNWISFSHLIYILDTKSFYNRCCFFHANGELTDGLNGYRIDSVLWLEFNEKESTITTNSIKANELWIKLDPVLVRRCRNFLFFNPIFDSILTVVRNCPILQEKKLII